MIISQPLEEIEDFCLRSLLETLLSKQTELDLEDSLALIGFPTYKDADDESVPIPLLLVSDKYGAILFNVSDAVKQDSKEFEEAHHYLDHAYRCTAGRLMRNKELAKGRNALRVPLEAAVYAPSLEMAPTDAERASVTVSNDSQLVSFLLAKKSHVDLELFNELLSTAEGSKALERPKKRNLEGQPDTSKGALARSLEVAISKFDQQQRRCFATALRGPERIRGLAGSGKTVVLAMKAAKTHLDNPEALIVYTFYTRSLYQHVRKLITRFCKMFSDQGPDWTKLKVMHGWGSQDMPGVYRELCRECHETPMSFSDAARISKEPFDYLCKSLLPKVTTKVLYDYVFIDEGQDFPPSFVQLVSSVTRDKKFVFAYDALQTIFRATPPTEADIFGIDEKGNPKVSFQRDEVLKTCYRNPREILVIAHAIGFGIYGPKKVQMIKEENYWEDIGYKLREGSLVPGSAVKIERLPENSLRILDNKQTIDDLVKMTVCASPAEEAEAVARSILDDLGQGLEPDDIMVITVDDRYAKTYLELVERALVANDIAFNNVHKASNFGERDFQIEKQVTLTTVHKAKGNEAYVVYILGADATFQPPNLRNRNILFTAITRAKGWVRISGSGDPAERLAEEIKAAKNNFPMLSFVYPDPKEQAIIDMNVQESAKDKGRIERELREVLLKARGEMTDDEISDFIEGQIQGQAKKEKYKELQDE